MRYIYIVACPTERWCCWCWYWQKIISYRYTITCPSACSAIGMKECRYCRPYSIIERYVVVVSSPSFIACNFGILAFVLFIINMMKCLSSLLSTFALRLYSALRQIVVRFSTIDIQLVFPLIVLSLSQYIIEIILVAVARYVTHRSRRYCWFVGKVSAARLRATSIISTHCLSIYVSYCHVVLCRLWYNNFAVAADTWLLLMLLL